MILKKQASTISSVVEKISSLSIELQKKDVIRKYLLEDIDENKLLTLSKIDDEMIVLAEDIIKRAVVLKNSLSI